MRAAVDSSPMGRVSPANQSAFDEPLSESASVSLTPDFELLDSTGFGLLFFASEQPNEPIANNTRSKIRDIGIPVRGWGYGSIKVDDIAIGRAADRYVNRAEIQIARK